jgi:hypothetical protein
VAGPFGAYAFSPSELVSQGGLYGSRRIDHRVAATSGDAEGTIAWTTINSPERMSIKGVRNIQFEEKILALTNSSSLQD